MHLFYVFFQNSADSEHNYWYIGYDLDILCSQLINPHTDINQGCRKVKGHEDYWSSSCFREQSGKKQNFLILSTLLWIRKDYFIHAEKRQYISCSLDLATNSETGKVKIQDFFSSTSIQAWRNKELETKNIISIQKICSHHDQIHTYVPASLSRYFKYVYSFANTFTNVLLSNKGPGYL